LEECYDPAPPSETEERATWHGHCYSLTPFMFAITSTTSLIQGELLRGCRLPERGGAALASMPYHARTR
jgi:hypothetical protein